MVMCACRVVALDLGFIIIIIIIISLFKVDFIITLHNHKKLINVNH